MNKNKKIGAWAVAFVALSLAAPITANAGPSTITLSLTNPVTGASDTETVSTNTTVAELRNTFVGVLGNGVAKHRLTYNGTLLRENERLVTAGAPDGATLGVGPAIGGLNLEVYRAPAGEQPSLDQTNRCTGGNVPTTVGTVNFQWGDGSVFNCQLEHVLVKFKGYIGFPTDRTVQFCTNSDDGNIVKIGGDTIISDWYDQGSGGGCGEVDFTANTPQSFEYDYYENGGGAFVYLNYQYTENGGATWSIPATVPTSAFINGSNWADETSNVITGIDGDTHKLTAAGKAAVDAWYNDGGKNLPNIRIAGNTDNNSANVARREISAVRNRLKQLGFTGTYSLVAHNGDFGNSDNGNVDEVRLPALNLG